MKTLIDNTLLHRLFEVINSKKHSTISFFDALTVLHFAENILFADEMEVVSYSSPKIEEVTLQTIDLLASKGLISNEQSRPLLNIIEYSNEGYANACQRAISIILDDLQGLDPATVEEYGSISARPSHVNIPLSQKWLAKGWSKNQREENKLTALEKKASGAIDYIICSNEVLYEKMQTFRKKLKGDNIKQAYGLDVLFRTAINQSLASERNVFYNPAPARSRAIQKGDELFRFKLSKQIHKMIISIKEDSPFVFLKELQNYEKLSLPIFAFHFLFKIKRGGPLQIIESARKLRDDPEVKSLRRWLNKWEQTILSDDFEKRRKAYNEIEDILTGVKVNIGKDYSLFSLLRCEIVLKKDGDIVLRPDFAAALENALMLLRNYSRRRIFLSNLTKELKYRRFFKRDLNDMFERTIIE